MEANINRALVCSKCNDFLYVIGEESTYVIGEEGIYIYTVNSVHEVYTVYSEQCTRSICTLYAQPLPVPECVLLPV